MMSDSHSQIGNITSAIGIVSLMDKRNTEPDLCQEVHLPLGLLNLGQLILISLFKIRNTKLKHMDSLKINNIYSNK